MGVDGGNGGVVGCLRFVLGLETLNMFGMID